MSIFNWGIYAGIGLAFPIGRYITELNIWNKVTSLPYNRPNKFDTTGNVEYTIIPMKSCSRISLEKEKSVSNPMLPGVAIYTPLPNSTPVDFCCDTEVKRKAHFF